MIMAARVVAVPPVVTTSSAIENGGVVKKDRALSPPLEKFTAPKGTLFTMVSSSLQKMASVLPPPTSRIKILCLETPKDALTPVAVRRPSS